MVEYVLSGHRLRVHIPKEGVTIVFAPSGIKTPSRPQPAANGKPEVKVRPQYLTGRSCHGRAA